MATSKLLANSDRRADDGVFNRDLIDLAGTNAGSTRPNHDGSSHSVNPTSNPTEPYDDNLPAEIDFSQGRRGQFHQHQARLNLPVYLEAEVEAYLG